MSYNNYDFYPRKREVKVVKYNKKIFRLKWKDIFFEWENSGDGEIATCLHFLIHEYRFNMQTLFNGYLFNDITYFKNEKDAKAACEWVNSIFIVNRLAEN